MKHQTNYADHAYNIYITVHQYIIFPLLDNIIFSQNMASSVYFTYFNYSNISQLLNSVKISYTVISSYGAVDFLL